MRQPRVIVEGATYHVTARTNRKDMLMLAAQAKDAFVLCLDEACQQFDFELHAWVIMDNHVHLLLTPGESSLADIMRSLLSSYAVSWNRMHCQMGHFWGERYHSRPIGSEIEFDHVMHYIINNPVRAELVESIGEWNWWGIAPPDIEKYTRFWRYFGGLSP